MRYQSRGTRLYGGYHRRSLINLERIAFWIYVDLCQFMSIYVKTENLCQFMSIYVELCFDSKRYEIYQIEGII